MRLKITFILIASACTSFCQTFTRSELPTVLSTPWEMTYGPDNHLYLTEKGGKVSRVDPLTGAKKVIFSASDFFAGDPSEACLNCFKPKIGSGTLGLTLHPDFTNPSTSFIYFVYSYNSGTATQPSTKFQIKRLTWDVATESVIADLTIVDQLPNGFDHLGGRLLAAAPNGVPHLYFTVGDNGVSEDNSPGCYVPESSNPNNFAQDPNYKAGKIHRFNMDGSIPSDNPLPGNSFFTRGHRNPQGLIYNPVKKVLYDVEHGDRTDDEINVLQSGRNYGWKNVRGYHEDDNCKDELQYIYSYSAFPGISGDALQGPLYSWCAASQSTLSNNMHWGTVAPSDGIYYNSEAISEWKNSLLVVTLKNGNTCDQELYCFKMNEDGRSLVIPTQDDPNPKMYFGADQKTNGRLRDIAVSPDGTKIFLCNNGGADRDKITVYTYEPPTGITNAAVGAFDFQLYPNPTTDCISISCSEKLESLNLYNILGEAKSPIATVGGINLSFLPGGTYYLKAKTINGNVVVKKVVKN